jgi:hypothetical protein
MFFTDFYYKKICQVIQRIKILLLHRVTKYILLNSVTFCFSMHYYVVLCREDKINCTRLIMHSTIEKNHFKSLKLYHFRLIIFLFTCKRKSYFLMH